MDRGFIIYTLIDITRSGQRRNLPGYRLQFGQETNWNSVLQSLSLRSQILFNTNPSSEIMNVSGLNLGTKYRGIYRIWKWHFGYTTDVSYDDLISDLDSVPVLTGLLEWGPDRDLQITNFMLKCPTSANTVIRPVIVS